MVTTRFDGAERAVALGLTPDGHPPFAWGGLAASGEPTGARPLAGPSSPSSRPRRDPGLGGGERAGRGDGDPPPDPDAGGSPVGRAGPGEDGHARGRRSHPLFDADGLVVAGADDGTDDGRVATVATPVVPSAAPAPGLVPPVPGWTGAPRTGWTGVADRSAGVTAPEAAVLGGAGGELLAALGPSQVRSAGGEDSRESTAPDWSPDWSSGGLGLGMTAATG
jgi:hypothetical protein